MKILFLSLALAICLGGAGQAAQTDPRLGSLFEQLAAARSAAESDPLETVIERLWLDHDSATIKVLMSRGLLALQEGLLDEADTYFSTAIETDPSYAEGWNKRATVRFLKEDFGGSVVDIEKTLALEPNHYGAMMGLGQILRSYGDRRGALQVFRKARRVHPNLPGIDQTVRRLTFDVEGQEI